MNIPQKKWTALCWRHNGGEDVIGAFEVEGYSVDEAIRQAVRRIRYVSPDCQHDAQHDLIAVTPVSRDPSWLKPLTADLDDPEGNVYLEDGWLVEAF